MTRIVWFLTFAGVITGNAAFKKAHPRKLGMLFGVDDQLDVKQSKERSLCETPECVALAKMMTESMNPDVDPCENFYEFACGNWAKQNPLPEGKDIWGPLSKATAVVNNRLLDILKSRPKPDDLVGLKLSQRALNACMNTDELERVGLDPLILTLWRIGGWPLIMEEDEWDDELYTWQYVDDYYASLIGSNSLYKLSVETPWQWDTDELFLRLDTPFLPYNMYALIGRDYVSIPDYDDNEGENGSQERGSEERPRDDDQEKDNSEENEDDEEYYDYYDEYDLSEEKRIVKKINKRAGGKMKKFNNGERIDAKHAGKKLTKRAVTRARPQHKSNSKQRKAKNQRIVRNKKIINKPWHDRKISMRHNVKTHLKPSHLNRNKADKKTNRYIYIDDDYTDDNTNDDENEIDIDGDPEQDYQEGSGNYNDYSEDGGSGRNDYDDTDQDDEEGSGYYYDEESSGDNDDEGSGDDENEGSGDYEDEEDQRRWQIEEEKKKVEQARKEYKEFVFNVTIALVEARDVEISEERIQKDIDDLLEFELRIMKIIYQDDGVWNATLGDIQKKYDSLIPYSREGQINWFKKVGNFLSSAGVEIDSDAMIVAPSDAYFMGLRRLLDDTPSRTIVNYVHWYFIRNTIKSTTARMRELYYNWNTIAREASTRLEDCIDNLQAKHYLGYEYVKRYISDDWLKTASDMVDSIQKEVEHQVEKSTWMDDTTREFILSKLVFMDSLLAYPPMYRNHTAMRQLMKGLSISKSHFENMMGIMRHMSRQNLKMLHSTTYKMDEYYIDPLIVNAFYMPFHNTFEITAADFQSPLYSPEQPWYTNFGIIGFIMAHEVNHGFDTMGRQFDRHGEYSKWLSAAADKAYEERADCFREQFTNYSMVKNMTANVPIENYGEQTSGENIADTMGLQAVFGAYQRQQRNCEVPDPMLPGLENFTNNQMFFLSSANVWCINYDMEKMKKRVARDSHSLPPLRVIGTLSNSKDFAEAFKCPVGSPMNPEKKCSIWN